MKDELLKEKAGFIGAGKVGMSLGAYLLSRGLNIAGYYSLSPASAHTAAGLTGSHAFESLGGLVDQCRLIFITTPDDQIGPVWNEISQLNLKGKIICHTSGSVNSGIFAGIMECGAYGYSVHPMYAFANRNGNVEGLERAYFTIEGDECHLQAVQHYLAQLGNKTIVIDGKNKVLYHMANVMVSNLVLALVDIGCECFENCGAGSGEALNALLPLITGNIENIGKQGFVSSLTGPAERNDAGTIMKHLEILPEKYGHIYTDLTLRLTELAGMKHPERDYSKLSELLQNYNTDK